MNKEHYEMSVIGSFVILLFLLMIDPYVLLARQSLGQGFVFHPLELIPLSILTIFVVVYSMVGVLVLRRWKRN